MPANTDILLESGTNELEVLVFTLGGNRYGVNVAKVREAIRPVPLTPVPESHPSAIGVFQLRDTITTLIDLHTYFNLKSDPPEYDSRRIIVTEFNQIRIAFLVDSVEQIYRVSWESVSPMPSVGTTETPVTSVCTIGESLVLMIDFERIVFDITGHDLFNIAVDQDEKSDLRKKTRILLAEDSSLMRNLITKNISRAGYSNFVAVEDGSLAWKQLQQQAAGELKETFDVVITDIEMPQLDGLALTKRIKETPQLAKMPVIVFSSLVSPDNAKKIEQVKADGQITKPELRHLVNMIDSLMEKVRGNATGQSNAPQREAVLT
ncbi:MAG: chemotaxis protein [Phycisphaerae bacterium]|nr:chemotaxis protein CheV [Phycisphaerales bacterium]